MNIEDKTRYLKTYFHINAGYVWGVGMDVSAFQKFEEEVQVIMESIGFEMQPRTSRSASLYATRGLEKLYCHPRNLSGYVKEESISEIKEALELAETFRLDHVKTWATAFNITSNEYINLLKENEQSLRNQVLDLFETRNRNLFKYKDLSKVKVVVESINKDHEHLHTNFVEALFILLLKEGWIVTSKNENGTIYRTLNKSETKEKLKKNA